MHSTCYKSTSRKKRGHNAHLYLHIHSLNQPILLKLVHQLPKLKGKLKVSTCNCLNKHQYPGKQETTSTKTKAIPQCMMT